MNKQSISPLTSLRFFAAFSVFTDHYLIGLFANPDKWGSPFGYIAITFFFVLSGFVLSYAYQSAFQSSAISKFKFYIGRLARIWPLHMLCIVLMLPFAIEAFNADWLKSLIGLFANILLIQDFIAHSADFLNGPAWSISAEMFFYICFPFLVVLAQKQKCFFNIALVLALCVLISFAILFSGTNDNPLAHNIGFHGVNISFAGIFYVFPPVRIIDFCCGIFLYFLYVRGLKIRARTYTYLESCAIICVICSYFLYQAPVSSLLKVDMLYLPACMFLIFIFSFSKGRLSHYLSKPALILLGEASFAFYMLQLPLYMILHDFIKVEPIFFECVHFVLLILISMAVHRYFEMPCYFKIREYFGVKRQVRLHNYLT